MQHSAHVVELERALQRTLPDARIDIAALPELPRIRLGLINSDYHEGPLAPEVMRAVLAAPAYWAFCWGSGAALAGLLLQDPQWVAGKHVVDLGSGSGVAAIAAALAGADRVSACDTDPDARLATRTNAALNDVAVDVSATLPARCDVLLMADVLYDRQNLALLDTAQRHARQILVADSRVTELPDPRYRRIAMIDSLTYPNLGEFDEFKTVHVFHGATS